MKKPVAPSSLDIHAAIMDFSVDYSTRTIYLFGDIDFDSSMNVVVALSIMDREEGPITLMLNTAGGHVESGYAIYDAIKMCQNHVTMVGLGSVMSMGAIIMQACDRRLMAPNARFMIHTGHADGGGALDSDKLISMGLEIQAMREQFVDILAERSGRSKRKVKTLLLKETYLSAKEACAMGFADGILAAPVKNELETELVEQ
ncbi:ClpP Protease subunit of ATP-dependent Clp proteases [uncultured Caudovirales phage]|uniref:ClpP Protease subunit of ATP-dependent Clp proteases n=1 Tax=uncultured Caudovirales phage TaxID=2100421 RepID=A0A6J5KZ12_9CAUD|nr:ClpP Protease subunit of ATP-dependent Clp proteases [uncultured Caudovirales phage]